MDHGKSELEWRLVVSVAEGPGTAIQTTDADRHRPTPESRFSAAEGIAPKRIEATAALCSRSLVPTRVPSSIKALIYDHDGTLVDSIAIVVAATNETLAAFGFATQDPAAIVEGMVDSTPVRLGRHAGVEEDGPRLEMASRYDAFVQDLAPGARLYPGVAELVRSMAMAAISQAVVSNSQGAFIRSILSRVELALLFDCLVGVDNMPAAKPDPRGVLAVLARMGRAPSDAVYVGDSRTDLLTARAAGIAAIGVSWGTHPRSVLEPLGFDHIVDSPEELAHFVLGTHRL